MTDLQLTGRQVEELLSILRVTNVMQGPTYLHRLLRDDPVLAPLIEHGLITWAEPAAGTGWSRAFRAVELTAPGHRALAASTGAHEHEISLVNRGSKKF